MDFFLGVKSVDTSREMYQHLIYWQGQHVSDALFHTQTYHAIPTQNEPFISLHVCVCVCVCVCDNTKLIKYKS